MTDNILNILGMIPENAWKFAHDFFISDMMQTIQFILICKDKLVRANMVKLLSQAINVTIEHHGFDLDQSKFTGMKVQDIESSFNLKKEKSVLDFLNIWFSLIPGPVSKNWYRFKQYFDVIFLGFLIVIVLAGFC